MPNTPRDYQIEAIEHCAAYFDRGTFNGVVQLPTGTGKSLVQQELVARLFPIQKYRSLLIGGLSRSLNHQALEGFRFQYQQTAYPLELWGKMLPGSGLVMANHNAVDARIVVGSAQTLVPKTLNAKKKIRENDPIELKDVCADRFGNVTRNPNSKREYLISPRFDSILRNGRIDLWIHDEAHHAPADGTLWMCNQLNLIYQHLGMAPLRHVGFTATPIRNDGRAMSNVYKLIFFGRTYPWAVENGYIVPYVDPPVQVEIVTQQGQQRELKVANNWMDRVYEGYMDHAHKRLCTATFVGPINGMGALEAGRELQQYFIDKGVPTVQVDGTFWIDHNGTKRSNNERKHLWALLNNRKVRHIINFGVLIEGIDVPVIDTIQLIRSVNEVTATQIMGRACRLYPGKENALLIDYTGQGVALVINGEMTGVRVNPFRQQEEEEQGLEEEKILTGRNLRDMNGPNYVQSTGNVYKDGSIRHKSQLDWFKGITGAWSLPLTRQEYGSQAFVVTMPYHDKADWYGEVKARLNDPQAASIADYLEKIYRHFVLWHTRASERWEPLTNLFKVGYSYKPHFIVGGDPILVSDNLDALEKKAADLTQTLEGFDKKIATKKGTYSWKKSTISEKQLPLLSGLYLKLSKEDVMALSSGDASQLISHGVAAKAVFKILEKGEAYVRAHLE